MKYIYENIVFKIGLTMDFYFSPIGLKFLSNNLGTVCIFVK